MLRSGGRQKYEGGDPAIISRLKHNVSQDDTPTQNYWEKMLHTRRN